MMESQELEVKKHENWEGAFGMGLGCGVIMGILICLSSVSVFMFIRWLTS